MLVEGLVEIRRSGMVNVLGEIFIGTLSRDIDEVLIGLSIDELAGGL